VISVVIPVYRNATTIGELYTRLTRVLRQLAEPYEIVFVDDACPDDSLRALPSVACADGQVVLCRLPRNVGQQRAVLAGLARARGTTCVVMDADLQDPPEAVLDLVSPLSADIAAVFAGRRGVYDTWWRLLTSRVFKTALRALCGTPMDAGLFVAMNAAMRVRLLADEPGPSVVAMMGCTRLRMISLPVERSRRADGRSSYTLGDLVKMAALTVAWLLRRKWQMMS
jgi:glycosyltransferase involved in cell wall biosynthesis